MIPHFSGTGTPWFDSLAKGTVMGLTLSTERRDIVKAILEGTTYELAVNLRLLERAGATVRELHAIGGSAKSPIDLQIRSSIMNRPILAMQVSEAASLGAAILAGAGADLYDSAESASSQLALLKGTFQPDPDLASEYSLCLDDYETIHSAIREVYSRDTSGLFSRGAASA
jgi:xylulokinase